jgi:hypothetical protein
MNYMVLCITPVQTNTPAFRLRPHFIDHTVTSPNSAEQSLQFSYLTASTCSLLLFMTSLQLLHLIHLLQLFNARYSCVETCALISGLEPALRLLGPSPPSIRSKYI